MGAPIVVSWVERAAVEQFLIRAPDKPNDSL
ncbi:hypothetical protein FB565_003062 [Actinoplanes lutulentus]|uniref:Uncharacterized protein n=1 Tax=Actinoplanes lutulentus TaxID=1287878 RepID=A0A327Z6F9_9ACTN|nr:hypothetical protein [Actinoplanes lutulentus]RAK28407.1 hypothetical protein B0I29_120175 [Actinoplanes lutulentus]